MLQHEETRRLHILSAVEGMEAPTQMSSQQNSIVMGQDLFLGWQRLLQALSTQRVQETKASSTRLCNIHSQMVVQDSVGVQILKLNHLLKVGCKQGEAATLQQLLTAAPCQAGP